MAEWRKPITGSRKVYVQGSRPDIRVPVREVRLAPVTGPNGREEQEPVRLYDTSGPYTDPEAAWDPAAGLPKLRETWIRERGDGAGSAARVGDGSDRPRRSGTGKAGSAPRLLHGPRGCVGWRRGVAEAAGTVDSGAGGRGGVRTAELRTGRRGGGKRFGGWPGGGRRTGEGRTGRA